MPEDKKYRIFWFDPTVNKTVYGAPCTLERAEETAKHMNEIIPQRKFYVEPIMTEEEKKILESLERCFNVPKI